MTLSSKQGDDAHSPRIRSDGKVKATGAETSPSINDNESDELAFELSRDPSAPSCVETVPRFCTRTTTTNHQNHNENDDELHRSLCRHPRKRGHTKNADDSSSALAAAAVGSRRQRRTPADGSRSRSETEADDEFSKGQKASG